MTVMLKKGIRKIRMRRNMDEKQFLSTFGLLWNEMWMILGINLTVWNGFKMKLIQIKNSEKKKKKSSSHFKNKMLEWLLVTRHRASTTLFFSLKKIQRTTKLCWYIFSHIFYDIKISHSELGELYWLKKIY